MKRGGVSSPKSFESKGCSMPSGLAVEMKGSAGRKSRMLVRAAVPGRPIPVAGELVVQPARVTASQGYPNGVAFGQLRGFGR
jgi:hypothetical protein